jgi:hypothetical protein
MAQLAIPLAVVGSVIGAGGKIKESRAQAKQIEGQGQAELDAARSLKVSKDYEADQLDFLVGEERATAQRSAREEQRKARLLESRAIAVGSASGAQGPSYENILADIATEGEYRTLTALYEGGSRANTMQKQAAARRFEGNEAMKAGVVSFNSSKKAAKSVKKTGVINAVGSLIGGASKVAGMMKPGGAKLEYVDMSKLPKKR